MYSVTVPRWIVARRPVDKWPMEIQRKYIDPVIEPALSI